MKNETELRALIGVLKFRLERDEMKVKELDRCQRETQRIYEDCGTMAHQKQLESQIKDYGVLILQYKKDVKKWKKQLEHNEKYLLHLINKNA